jgi:hypothetical protein
VLAKQVLSQLSYKPACNGLIVTDFLCVRDHLLLGFDLQIELRARAAQLRSSEQLTVSSSMLTNALTCMLGPTAVFS